MESYLVDGAGRRFSLARPATTLGRSNSCEVFIPDQRVSRRHAEIRWDGDFCMLHDLGSANGTFLNGCRVVDARMLRDGDEITLGSAVFTFRDPETTLREADFPLFVVDAASGEVWVNRVPVLLSPKERILFDFLYRNAGQVCSKQQIAEVVWPEYRAEVYDYQVESLVKRLREKLEPDPRNPVLIITVRGQGYKLLAV